MMVSPSPLPLTGSSSGEPKAMGARHPQHELAIRRASVVSGRLTMGLRLQEPPLWVLHARLWRTVIPAGAAVFRGRSALPACSVVSEGIEATPSVSWPATWKRRRAFLLGLAQFLARALLQDRTNTSGSQKSPGSSGLFCERGTGLEPATLSLGS